MHSNLPPYLLAFLAGAFYSLSALLCKRGLEMGCGTIRSLIFSNVVMALFFIPYPILESSFPNNENIMAGVFLGALFFLSQTACFFALQKGDASMVTPIMGSKSIFVAVFVSIFGLSGLPSIGTWVATILTAIAVALISWKNDGTKLSTAPICLGLLSASGFGLTDALVPAMAQKLIPLQVLFMMFSTVGILSLLLIPFSEKSLLNLKKEGDRWMILSTIPMGIQAVLMSLAIGFYQVPAEANVFYACRGIWAIIMAIWIGKIIGLKESKTSKVLFYRRLAGAILIVIGICFIPI